MQTASRRPREGEVRLTSFFTYQGQFPDRVTLDNIPLPNDLKPSPVGLTTLIGFRDALEELQFQRQLAEARDEKFVTVTIRLGIDELYNNFTDLENAEKKSIINLNRISPDLFDIVKSRMGKSSTDSVTNFVVEDTELLAELHKEPHFHHADLLIYKIADPYRKMRRIGTLFSRRHILDVTANGRPEITVELPDFLPSTDDLARAPKRPLRRGVSR
jgi:hypothetical protein